MVKPWQIEELIKEISDLTAHLKATNKRIDDLELDIRQVQGELVYIISLDN